MITANELNQMLGISLTGDADALTDQELRMWVVELMIENNGSVALAEAEAMVKYIKTGEV